MGQLTDGTTGPKQLLELCVLFQMHIESPAADSGEVFRQRSKRKLELDFL